MRDSYGSTVRHDGNQKSPNCEKVQEKASSPIVSLNPFDGLMAGCDLPVELPSFDFRLRLWCTTED